MDDANKPVALARNGFYVSGMLSRVAQRVSQAVHGFLERQVIVHKRIVWPELVAQLVSRDDFLGMLKKALQDLKGVGP